MSTLRRLEYTIATNHIEEASPSVKSFLAVTGGPSKHSDPYGESPPVAAWTGTCNAQHSKRTSLSKNSSINEQQIKREL